MDALRGCMSYCQIMTAGLSTLHTYIDTHTYTQSPNTCDALQGMTAGLSTLELSMLASVRRLQAQGRAPFTMEVLYYLYVYMHAHVYVYIYIYTYIHTHLVGLDWEPFLFRLVTIFLFRLATVFYLY
jgi:hypothetical protein